ncbi:hypothetical protein ACFB49_30260 [Sphingomonas sp. DBB INV C78]
MDRQEAGRIRLPLRFRRGKRLIHPGQRASNVALGRLGACSLDKLDRCGRGGGRWEEKGKKRKDKSMSAP